MDSCFGISTFYIGFCYYQLNQYDRCEAVFFKVEIEVLRKMEIVMKKKLVLYQLLLIK